MQKKFAFLLMNPGKDPDTHEFSYAFGDRSTIFRTVRDFDEAREQVLRLAEEGVGVIELCGAFGPERAREYIGLTGGKVGIGYVVVEPEQGELFSRFFGD